MTLCPSRLWIRRPTSRELLLGRGSAVHTQAWVDMRVLLPFST